MTTTPAAIRRAATQPQPESTMNTIAQQVSSLLNNDGSVWETEDGKTLPEIAREFGGIEEYEDDPDLPGRIEFPDGSAICYGDLGWGIEVYRELLMEGLE